VRDANISIWIIPQFPSLCDSEILTNYITSHTTPRGVTSASYSYIRSHKLNLKEQNTIFLCQGKEKNNHCVDNSLYMNSFSKFVKCNWHGMCNILFLKDTQLSAHFKK